MKKKRQEENGMGKEQAEFMIQIVKLLRKEEFISEAERKRSEYLIEKQVKNN